ncbi:MAG: tRNA 2-thiouridine(34) synthase MnmA [Oscillospiraceae bacterium]|nr:tRNA 2-thiouridine(34) synthase MnmA [Oscillospiraceae bacterium]
MNNDRRVLAAMSGGVDSSVAALLLAERGYDVTGVMMKLFENEDIGEDILSSCCSLADRSEAEAAAAKIDVPFYVYNYAEEFRRGVMDYFAAEYCRGRTPNPCIECNRLLKFGALFWRADSLKCGFVATGHYARVERQNGRYLLRRSGDARKDQTYALYFLTQEQLARTLFPLGEYTKPEVREIAARFGLPNAAKPDSEDICFVPGGGYGAFLDLYTGEASEPGDFVSADGAFLGRHRGYRNYTIGQRRGLGVSSGGKLYVAAIDPAANVVTLGPADELYGGSLVMTGINLIAADSLVGEVSCQAKIRYGAEPAPATARQTGADEITVTFREPRRAITPGQACVLYDGDLVLGGGVIRSASPS